MAHDFNKYPELSNSQMQVYYFESPHKQITEDFDAHVEKVVDGDTIRVSTNFRDFDFPIRFLDINAPEMSEGGGEAREFLKTLIDGKDIQVKINRYKRVGKFGRLLGIVMQGGIDINQAMLNKGHAVKFGENSGKITDIERELSQKKWF